MTTDTKTRLKVGEAYTVEEIAKLGFEPTGHSFADLQIYRRDSDRCLFEVLSDGRLNAYMTYQF